MQGVGMFHLGLRRDGAHGMSSPRVKPSEPPPSLLRKSSTTTSSTTASSNSEKDNFMSSSSCSGDEGKKSVVFTRSSSAGELQPHEQDAEGVGLQSSNHSEGARKFRSLAGDGNENAKTGRYHLLRRQVEQPWMRQKTSQEIIKEHEEEERKRTKEENRKLKRELTDLRRQYKNQEKELSQLQAQGLKESKRRAPIPSSVSTATTAAETVSTEHSEPDDAQGESTPEKSREESPQMMSLSLHSQEKSREESPQLMSLSLHSQGTDTQLMSLSLHSQGADTESKTSTSQSIASLATALVSAENELEQMKEAMEAVARLAGKQRDQIDTLRGQLKDEYSAAKSYRKRAVTAESEREELRESLAREREKYEGLRVELFQRNGRVKQLEKERDEIRRRLTMLKTYLKKVFERRKSNREERRLFRRRNSQRQESEEADSHVRHFQSSSSLMGETGGRVQELRDQVRRLEEDLNAKVRQNVVLESLVDVCSDELDERFERRLSQGDHGEQSGASKGPRVTAPSKMQRIERVIESTDRAEESLAKRAPPSGDSDAELVAGLENLLQSLIHDAEPKKL